MRARLCGSLAAGVLFIVLLCVVFAPAPSQATPRYSEKTGQGCMVCHKTAQGGELTETGLLYAASGYVWPPKGGYRVIGPLREKFRLFVGFFHIVAAFLWFGTILYVHILLRPAYASSGLPRGEMGLGIASMAVVGVTGVLLTISRINEVSVLYSTAWGMMLLAKIVLYLIMVTSAVVVVVFVSPRLKKGEKRTVFPASGVFGPEAIGHFDGKEGRPALIAYRGKVYEVTGLKLWKGGAHVKHRAGADLTEALSKAPHGEEKLEGLKTAGEFDPSAKPPMTLPQRVFYFIAYMNLVLVFAVLFVIAYWRWGI